MLHASAGRLDLFRFCALINSISTHRVATLIYTTTHSLAYLLSVAKGAIRTTCIPWCYFSMT